jgi:hypothetical protein
MRQLVSIGIVAITAACGGDGTGPADPGSELCSITLSGGQTGTYSCDAFSASSSTFESKIEAGDSKNGISMSFVFNARLSVRSFTPISSENALATISVTRGAFRWFATRSLTDGYRGWYSFNVSSVTPLTGDKYTIHGTLDATLVPEGGTGASGNVTLKMTF